MTENGNGKLIWNWGDLLHFLEIITVVFYMGVTYAQFKGYAEQVARHTQQLDRIEHYLSSHDATYWPQSKQDE